MHTRGGRGLGPGPVFIYEWITSTRRWQAYALRSLFVLGLLLALLVMGMRRGTDAIVPGPAGLRALAQLGRSLFVAVVGTQLTLVLLVAPAGAICLDRSRGTLAHLLVTDLTDVEIVLGKLAARLTPVLVLVAATLPFTALLTLLGGIEPDAMFGAFLVTMGVAVLGCCLALGFSIRFRRTHEALLATYAVWGLWLLGTPMLDQINRASGLSLIVPPESADPYRLAFAPYWRPGSVDWHDYVAFLGAIWGISAVLTLLAVRTMRRICTRDAARTSARPPWGWAGRLGAFVSPAFRIYGRMGPTLDFNPVFWREWHRNRPARWARVVALIFVALALTFSLIAINQGSQRDLPPWVNALQVSIGLLFLSVIAATSMAEERVRGSLDVLLTTPLETREIVLGKWLGTYRLVPPLAILPVLVVYGKVSPDGDPWPVALMMAAFVLCAGAAITSLGLAMATWCSRLGRAVGVTVSLYLLMAVGWFFGLWAVRDSADTQRMMMGSPFFWAGIVTDSADRRYYSDYQQAAIGWTLAYALAAWALLAATLKTFDRCLGRVEGHSQPPPMPSPERKGAMRRSAEV
jgi:ABC-type transport system involved in multi-copper enzyme maturation permease subunit